MNKEQLIEQIEILAKQLESEGTMRHDNLELTYGRMNGHNGWNVHYGYLYRAYADEMEVALELLKEQLRVATQELLRQTELKLIKLRELNKL